jgi:2-haloalkanoic acid dehalogenase type II
MSIKAITFDAYGTLVRNEKLILIPQRIVADHGLSASVDAVFRMWLDFYFEATQQTPFRTLRTIQETILARVLRAFDVPADAGPYVDLFFELTTQVELYPETLDVLSALAPLPSAVVSNADHEHIAAWTFTLPVHCIVISEAVQAYKPHRLMFQAALARLGVQPHDVLHVGDSDVDDIQGAKAAGLRVAWVNRDGRSRRPGVPAPDFEIADLSGLLTLVGVR